MQLPGERYKQSISYSWVPVLIICSVFAGSAYIMSMAALINAVTSLQIIFVSKNGPLSFENLAP